MSKAADENIDISDAQETPGITLVNGSQVTPSPEQRFLVRNVGRYEGSFVVNGVSQELGPGAHVILSEKPSALTVHLVVQAL